MLRRRTTIENTDETVTKSIGHRLLSKFNGLFKLEDISVDLVINEKDFKKKKFNVGDQQNSEQNQTTFVRANIVEKIEEGHVAVTRIRSNNTKTLLYDKYPNISVNVLYVPTTLELNVTYFSKSQTKLENLASIMRMIHIQDNKSALLNIFYRFYATPYLTDLLKNVYSNYNDLYPNSKTIEEYIKDTVNNEFTLLSNITGTKANLGFQQHVRGVLGRFTSDILNMTLDYDKDSTYWSISFDFTLNYEKPLYMDITHDIAAYNKSLKNKFQVDTRYTLKNVRSFTANGEALHDVNGLTIEEYLGYSEKSFYTKYITIPEFDATPDLKDLPDMLRLMTVYVNIDGNEDKTLFNLEDLTEVNLKKEILEYIRDVEHEFVTTKYQSMFHIQLWANRDFINDGIIKLSSDLNVMATVPLNKDFTYRVSFSVITDLSLLPKTALDRINKYPHILKLIETMLSYNYGDVNNGLSKLDKDMMHDGGAILVPVDMLNRTVMKTVQVSHVISSLLNKG